jgi:hypothetical protein
MSDSPTLPPTEEPTAEPLPPPPLPAEPPARRPLLPWLTAAGFVILAAAVVWISQHPLIPPASTEATDSLARQVNALQERVSRLEQRPMPTAPDLGALNARVTALEQRPAPQTLSAASSTNLELLENRVAALEQRQPPDLQPLVNRLTALDARQQQAGAELSARIAALENADRTMQTDLAHRADAATAAARHGALVEIASLALAAGQKLGDLPGAPPALARFADAAPPTLASLRLTFPAAAREALGVSRPPTEGKPLVTRLWAQAQDLVTVRQGDHVLVGVPAAGLLERARSALEAGDLRAAVADIGSLQGAPAQAMAGWLAQAQALLAAKAALIAWAQST